MASPIDVCTSYFTSVCVMWSRLCSEPDMVFYWPVYRDDASALDFLARFYTALGTAWHLRNTSSIQLRFSVRLARQGKARQGKARQGKARQGSASKRYAPPHNAVLKLCFTSLLFKSIAHDAGAKFAISAQSSCAAVLILTQYYVRDREVGQRSKVTKNFGVFFNIFCLEPTLD